MGSEPNFHGLLVAHQTGDHLAARQPHPGHLAQHARLDQELSRRGLGTAESRAFVNGIVDKMGRALKQAVSVDPAYADEIPSTKGVL